MNRSSIRFAAAAIALLSALPGICAARDYPNDRDDNPPGPAGGPGTNWENPPGSKGGPGASPDRERDHEPDLVYRYRDQQYVFTPSVKHYYFNPQYGYWLPELGFWNQEGRCWIPDNGANPPGPRRGRNMNWNKPPGTKNGPGRAPDQYKLCGDRAANLYYRDRDDNPPGPAGGRGTNWENPPGSRGGPGASPDRVYRYNNQRYVFTPTDDGYYVNPQYGYWHPDRGFWNQKDKCWKPDDDSNPPGPAGGPGTNWENPPGSKGGPGASPDRYGRCH